MANAGVSTDVRKSNSTVEPPTTNHDVTKIVKDKKNVFLTHGEPLFRSTYLKENQAPNSTEDITVIPEINGDIKAIVAVRTENGQTVAYRSIKKNNGNFELTVPAGIYDICALGYCDNRKGTVIVTKENVELNENTNLNIDLSEAFNTVQLKRISPSGEELKISDEYGNGEECGPGMAVNFIEFK